MPNYVELMRRLQMEHGELMRRLWSHVGVGDKVVVEHGTNLSGPRWHARWCSERVATANSEVVTAKVRTSACGDTPEEAILRLCHMLDHDRRQRAAAALAKGATAGQVPAADGQGHA